MSFMMKIRFYLFLFIATISIICCKKENTFEDSYDSIYSVWSLTTDIQHTKNTEYQPVDDRYPIVLSFTSSNQICGYHDANSYEGYYSTNGKYLTFKNISSTDVSDNKWYINYLNNLQCVYEFETSGPDTLILVAENNTNRLVFLSKNKFHSNVDSIYSYFPICKTDSSNIVNTLHGSWVLIYLETSMPNPEHIDKTSLCILPNDSIYGKSGNTNYYGKCRINGNSISVSINYDNNNTSHCFADYIERLTSTTTYNVYNDSLKLKNGNDFSLLEFTKMSK